MPLSSSKDNPGVDDALGFLYISLEPSISMKNSIIQKIIEVKSNTPGDMEMRHRHYHRICVNRLLIETSSVVDGLFLMRCDNFIQIFCGSVGRKMAAQLPKAQRHGTHELRLTATVFC